MLTCVDCLYFIFFDFDLAAGGQEQNGARTTIKGNDGFTMASRIKCVKGRYDLGTEKASATVEAKVTDECTVGQW